MANDSSHAGEAIRRHLVEALRADAIGPYGGREGLETSTEVLPYAPSRWYLTGFLAPSAYRDIEDVEAEDDLASGPDLDAEEATDAEAEAKQRKQYPASLGLSVLLPPEVPGDTLEVGLTYAEYVPEHPVARDGTPEKRRVWRRVPRLRIVQALPLERGTFEVPVRDASGVRYHGTLERVAGADKQGLPVGTRALSLFVVNERGEAEDNARDRQFLFQVELSLRYARGFCARPNRKGEKADHWDENVADLQFRDRAEHAVGHNVSTQVARRELVDGELRVTEVRTAWIPEAEVARVRTRRDDAIETRMSTLAEASASAEALRAVLEPLPAAYARWIDEQRKNDVGSEERSRTQELLLDKAEAARDRIADGIAALVADPLARRAFGWMNGAMGRAAEQQGRVGPSWHLFQLAFVLLNVRGVLDPTHADRERVELIFFPTGGGKTEAYLGLIAFTLLVRRMRHQSDAHGGLGVAVLLRYTLRLLTLDQLRRASTLICALELIRRAHPKELGKERFAIGLWVGRSATANTLSEVVERTRTYEAGRGGSPFPLPVCPWCGHALGEGSLLIHPKREKPEEVRVLCTNIGKCAFEGDDLGLPVLFVDEQIYRELPCLIVATVDKFAMMPWRGEVGMLFGRALARAKSAPVEKLFGPLDRVPKKAMLLPMVEGAGGLLPPELIVQDELHLISGPLGTMVGLYEATIEALCTRGTGPPKIVPKIVASTATVRRADLQVQALFGRSLAVFPPPGVDENETFFSEVDRDAPGRLYVGFAAPARPLKQILIRAYTALLCAAQKAAEEHGDGADAYRTLVGYFNAIRELGGMRRLVQDQVSEYAKKQQIEHCPEDAIGPNPWYARREIGEPLELTSREKTDDIKETKRRLDLPSTSEEGVDVVLASNMISVGVDIERLGLMVIAGQPKTTSEYIQASSRVGRRAQWPGLVVTCFNLVKPRDRSHYERFTAYHESFYRHVEAQSLTPFSRPALERGLAGSLVGLARLLVPELTPPSAAREVGAHRQRIEAAAERLARRAAAASGDDARDRVEALLRSLLDAWTQLASDPDIRRSYSPYDREKAEAHLLRTALDDDRDASWDERRFVAPTSMRDVEASAHLWVVTGLPPFWRKGKG